MVEEIYHEGGEGVGRAGIGGVFRSFVFPASRGSPLCALVVNIHVPGSFAYPVV
ncbi:MAG: hypothetical protein LBH51_04940 [Treponema sp.]|nr:hypothetical protein [Treponema sp.]